VAGLSASGSSDFMDRKRESCIDSAPSKALTRFVLASGSDSKSAKTAAQSLAIAGLTVGSFLATGGGPLGLSGMTIAGGVISGGGSNFFSGSFFGTSGLGGFGGKVFAGGVGGSV